MIKVKNDEMVYSDKIKGEDGNWNWEVRFDMSGAYLGISQFHPEKAENTIERVLLSPKQIKALLKFLQV